MIFMYSYLDTGFEVLTQNRFNHRFKIKKQWWPITTDILTEKLTLSPTESVMETCSVVLTFESVDEILWCDHSNETSSAVLLHGTIYFSIFYKMKFENFLEF